MTTEHIRNAIYQGATGAMVIMWAVFGRYSGTADALGVLTAAYALAIAVFLIWSIGDKVALTIGGFFLIASILIAGYFLIPAAMRVNRLSMACLDIREKASTSPVRELEAMKARADAMGCQALP